MAIEANPILPDRKNLVQRVGVDTKQLVAIRGPYRPDKGPYILPKRTDLDPMLLIDPAFIGPDGQTYTTLRGLKEAEEDWRRRNIHYH